MKKRWLIAIAMVMARCSADGVSAAAGDGLEIPPPPAMDMPLPDTAAAQPQKRSPREIATAVRANSIDVDDAQQIWPRPGATGAQGDSGVAPLSEITGLPPGIRPNPNIPSATAAALNAVPANPASGNALAPVLNSIRQDAAGHSALESTLYAQLRQAMPQGSTGYLFENATLPAQLKLPRTQYSVRFDFRMPQRGIGATPFTGNVLDASGQVFSRFSGSVLIDREASGIQVTRVISRGEVLKPADVQQLGTRLSQLPRGAFETSQALAGTTAKSELRPGAWLTSQMVQTTDAVTRGQAVTMRLAHGPPEITAPGVTKEAGAIGQVIKVENAQSHREIFARIVNSDQVQVVN